MSKRSASNEEVLEVGDYVQHIKPQMKLVYIVGRLVGTHNICINEETNEVVLFESTKHLPLSYAKHLICTPSFICVKKATYLEEQLKGERRVMPKREAKTKRIRVFK